MDQPNIVLYPTETIYGLGVDVFDLEAIQALHTLKGRPEEKPASWLVRNLQDIERYGVVSDMAARIIDYFLPGELTLVLEAKSSVPEYRRLPDNEVSFRISADPIAQQVIAEHMAEYGTPLTCTSANVSGLPPQATPSAILEQFGGRAEMITKVVDDGPRTGTASTVVRIVGDQIEVLREGNITQNAIINLIRN